MENKSAEESWQEFLKWISDKSNGFVFRGEADINNLLKPSVGRLDNYSLKNEINMFEQFKLKANMFTSAKTDFEWLSIAQHHSLKTRLLDWTENPLVACFFAVSDKKNEAKDGQIYCCKFNKTMILKDLSIDPFSIQKVMYFYPPTTTNRITLQKGLFSIHPFPNKACLILPYDDNWEGQRIIEAEEVDYYLETLNAVRFSNLLLFRNYQKEIEHFQKDYYNKIKPSLSFKIKKEYKEYFKKQVRLLGIDETIYGDLDSIGKDINYVGENNLLTVLRYPNKSIEFRQHLDLIKNKLRNHTLEIFKELKNLNYIIIHPRINIDLIPEDNEQGRKLYKVKGQLDFYPNYFNSQDICWKINKTENQIVKKKLACLIEIFPNKKFQIENPFTRVRFEFDYFIGHEIGNSKLEESDLERIDNIKSIYDLYHEFYLILDKDDKKVIENNDIKLESKNFKIFISKIKTKDYIQNFVNNQINNNT